VRIRASDAAGFTEDERRAYENAALGYQEVTGADPTQTFELMRKLREADPKLDVTHARRASNTCAAKA
jgi:hypothetical protein